MEPSDHDKSCEQETRCDATTFHRLIPQDDSLAKFTFLRYTGELTLELSPFLILGATGASKGATICGLRFQLLSRLAPIPNSRITSAQLTPRCRACSRASG